MVHLDDCVDALPRPKKEGLDCLGRRNGVAVERDDLEPVAGKRNAAILDGAGIEQMKEYPLALLDAYRLSGPKGLVIDGVRVGVDLETVGVGVQDGGLFELRIVLAFLVGVLHVAGEERLPVAEREEYLLVVLAGVVARVDDKKAELARVRTFMQV